jgi:hypothetical protein
MCALNLLITSSLIIIHTHIDITHYDPALGGINCDGHCEHIGAFIDFTPDLYGKLAACPLELYGSKFQVIGSRWGLADGEYECRDSGGLIKILSNGVVRVDLLLPYYVWRDVIPAIFTFNGQAMKRVEDEVCVMEARRVR